MIELYDISKVFELRNNIVSAIQNINVKIDKGEFVAIVGPSGSGKSTLLSILGCLSLPSSGQYVLSGVTVSELDDDSLAEIRSLQIGFVFQSYNLIPRYSALENVQMPMIYAGILEEERLDRAKLALNAVGMSDRYDHTPAELSGGQQQRVAIARAIVNNPKLIIADEPTGSLDEHSTQDVINLFQQLHMGGRTIVFVTHNMDLLPYATRVLKMEHGQLVDA